MPGFLPWSRHHLPTTKPVGPVRPTGLRTEVPPMVRNVFFAGILQFHQAQTNNVGGSLSRTSPICQTTVVKSSRHYCK